MNGGRRMKGVTFLHPELDQRFGQKTKGKVACAYP